MHLLNRPHLPFLLLCLVEWAATSSSDGRSSSVKARKSSPSAISTCRSASVNHVTHTLPQQCLAGNRTAATRAATSSSAGSALATVQTNVTSSESQTAPVPITTSASGSPPDLESTSNDQSSHTSTTAPSVEVQSTLAAAEEAETDSPLDTANFLSFEDWKRKNLASVGQSPEHVGQHRAVDDKQRRTRPGSDSVFDVLGEDSEIELDFSGFGGTQTLARAPVENKGRGHSSQGDVASSDRTAPSQQNVRSKDAGTTCKERTNYASFDCAATVLKTNPECKSASSVLVENKDSYMLNICKVKNKFFIVELCNDILIDTVVLANYEFFSSIFRTFRLSVSDRYPAKADKWRELGTYEARNARQVQAFLIEQPLIWARFLRIEILSHYGNEYYCPVSLLRVHGTTMMEEFRHQEEISRGEYPEDVGTEETETLSVASSTQPQEPAPSSIEADRSIAETPITALSSVVTELATPSVESHTSVSTTTSPIVQPAASSSSARPSTAAPSREDLPSTMTDRSLDVTVKTNQSSGKAIETPSEVVNTNSSTPAPLSLSSAPPPSVAVISAAEAQLSMPTSSTVLASDGGTTSVAVAGANKTHVVPVEDAVLRNRTKSSATSKPSSTSPVQSSSSSKHAPSVVHSETSRKAPHGASSVSPAPAVPSTQESFFKSIHKRLQTLESNATLSLQYIEDQSKLLRSAFSKVEKRQIGKTETFLQTLNKTVTAELQSFRAQYDQLWESTVLELESQREQYQSEMVAVSARLNLVAEELLFQKRMVIVQSTLLMLCLGLVLFTRMGGSSSSAGVVGLDLQLPLLQQMMAKSGLGGSYGRSRTNLYSPAESPSPNGDASPQPDGGANGKISRAERMRFWRRSLSPGFRSEDTGTPDEDMMDDTRGLEVRLQAPSPRRRDDHAASMGYDTDPADGRKGGSGDDGSEVEAEAEADREEEAEEDEVEETELAAHQLRVDHGSSEKLDGVLASIELSGQQLPLETQSSPATPTGTRDLSPLLHDDT